MTIKEGERLSVLETKVDRAVSDISDIKTQTTQEFAALNTKFDNFVDALDKKYAARWVQTAVTFVVALIVGAVITALLALVIIPATESKNPTSTTSNTTINSTSPSSSTKSTPSSASATSTATSTPANPTASDSSTSGGGVNVTLPKAQ